MITLSALSEIHAYNVSLLLLSLTGKNEEKKAAEKVGGGGKAGITARTQSQISVTCAVCKLQFASSKMKVQLKDHWEAKHPKGTFKDCFPNESGP